MKGPTRWTWIGECFAPRELDPSLIELLQKLTVEQVLLQYLRNRIALSKKALCSMTNQSSNTKPFLVTSCAPFDSTLIYMALNAVIGTVSVPLDPINGLSRIRLVQLPQTTFTKELVPLLIEFHNLELELLGPLALISTTHRALSAALRTLSISILSFNYLTFALKPTSMPHHHKRTSLAALRQISNLLTN